MKLQILILALPAVFGMASGMCKFMDNTYAVGTTIMQSGCRQIVCKTDGDIYFWVSVPAPLDECDTCCVYMDPRIRTFDQTDHYSWHGTCRYSLVEYLLECAKETAPKFAVYGDFKKCDPWGAESCVDMTSYQLSSDIDDVLHVQHPNVFKVSNFDFSDAVDCNNPEPTPVVIGSEHYQAFCWSENGYMNILGPDLLVTFGESEACTTASKEYMCLLGGLCGKYNGIASDDHTDRSGFEYPWNSNVLDFATSWQVPPYDYVDKDCEESGRKKRNAFKEEEECPEKELMKYLEICREYLMGFTENEDLFNDILMACAEDLCAFPDDQDKWLQIALQTGQEQNALLFPKPTKG